MKKYKHKIIVINNPFKVDGFVDVIVLRKNHKKRWSRKRYERRLNKITFKWESKFLKEEDIIEIPIFPLIPDVEEYMQ